MKKMVIRILSISLAVTMFVSQTLSVLALEDKAETNTRLEVEAGQQSKLLNSDNIGIAASDVTVSNNGYSTIMGDSDVKIYYQEGTGLNTIAFTEFTVNDDYYGEQTAQWSESENAFVLYSHTFERNVLKVRITDNPVASKKAGDSFHITCSVAYTDDYGVTSTTTITVPAEIVKVEGKITDKADVMEEHYLSYKDKPQTMHDLWDKLYNKYANNSLTYTVKLDNGTTTTAKGIFVKDNLAKGGGSGIQPGIVRGYYLYNLKYKANITGIIPGLWRGGRISIVDANNNVYAFKNNSSDVQMVGKMPTVPSKVTSTIYGYDDIKLSWSKSAGATGYYVYYKKSTAKTWTQLAVTSSTTLKKANLADGVKYNFRVYPYVKYNGKNYIIDTHPNVTKNYRDSSIYTLKKVSKPTIKKSSKKYIKISWKNINGESGYQIARSTKKTKGFKVVKTVNSKYKSVKLKTPRNKKYYYKIRAYKTVNGKKIYAPWSTVKSYKLK